MGTLSVNSSLPDSFNGFRVIDFHIFRLSITSNVHLPFLYNDICADERCFYPRRKYAGLGNFYFRRHPCNSFPQGCPINCLKRKRFSGSKNRNALSYWFCYRTELSGYFELQEDNLNNQRALEYNLNFKSIRNENSISIEKMRESDG